jgi:hypothetical protein
MAEIWGAAIVAVGAYAASNNAANKAAGAQKRGAAAASAAIQQNYDRTKSDLQPYITLGGNAAGTLNALNSGDMSAFHADPGYQFAFDQGLQGLDRSAAARGSLYSGGHSADLIRYGQGMADQQYGQFYDRLMGLAGMGQNASSNLGSVGTGSAASIGSNLMSAGNAAANGYINSGNAQANLLGQFGQLYGQYMGQQGSPTNSSYSLGGNGAQSYQVNDGSFNNGTFNFATAGDGSQQRYAF